MGKVTVALSAALVGVLLFGAPAGAQDSLNCENFTYQEEAQAELARDLADPNVLDEDKDGIACEDLPSSTAPPVDDTATPNGGVDTGLGGMAGGDGSSPVPIVIGGLAAAGLGVLALRRLRPARSPR